MSKKRAAICGLLALLTAVGLYAWLSHPSVLRGQQDGATFRTNRQTIEIQTDGTWKPFEVLGVNMGTGYPGVYPNEFGIGAETYQRWFQEIGEMNANVIRVYKTQSPEFYTALVQYNQTHEKKLYLIQGIDFSEKLQFSEENILDPKVSASLFRDTEDLVDMLHGKHIALDTSGAELYSYHTDISDYVLGYLLGIEWDKVFVEYVCRLNQDLPPFQGEYLFCETAANGFENFLAQWGDRLLSYEEETYQEQKLVSFCNWPDTDPMVNELKIAGSVGAKRDFGEAKVDVEHILQTERVRGGMFASYNVYPYFPTFLQYGPYTRYKDAAGQSNPYQGYLRTLTAHHTCPVIISEYGIPASRSVSYEDIWLGSSHGGLTEGEQAEAVTTLLSNVRAAGCAGSMAFSWQDEWYKTTWNEKMLSDPDYRAYWSNAECAEQFFGMVSFEPGQEGGTPYPDGDLSDWQGQDVIAETDQIQMKIQSNEKYVYFLLESMGEPLGFPFNIAVDTLPDHGEDHIGGTEFLRPIEFMLRMDRKDAGRLFVQKEYRALPYSALGGYHDTTLSSLQELKEQTQLGVYPPQSQEFYLVSRASGDIHKSLRSRWNVNEVGRLKPGNANPESPDYDSNADFCFAGDNAVEIRIPWQLLNFYAPSKCEIIDAPEENDYRIQGLKIDEIYAAVYEESQQEVSDFGAYKLESWEEPTFHERLKPSYYAMQKAFGEAQR